MSDETQPSVENVLSRRLEAYSGGDDWPTDEDLAVLQERIDQMNDRMVARAVVVLGKPCVPPPAPDPKLQRVRTELRVHAVLATLELLVPKRLCDEEVGDALEMIDRLQRLGAAPWRVYLKLVTTVLWVLFHAAAEIRLGTKRKT